MLPFTISVFLVLNLISSPAGVQARPDLSGRWIQVEAAGSSPWSSDLSIRQSTAGLMVGQALGAAPTEYRFDQPFVEVLAGRSACQNRTLSRKATWIESRVVLSETIVQPASCHHDKPLWPPASATDPEAYQALTLAPSSAVAPNSRPLFESEVVLSIDGDTLTVSVTRRSSGGGEIVSEAKYRRSDNAR